MPDKPLSLSFNLPFAEAIEQAKARKVMLPQAYYDLPAEKRAQAFTVGRMATLDQIQAVLNALTQHMEQGVSLQAFKKQAESMNLGLSPGKINLVFRNAVQTAYNAGSWRNFEAHQSSRPLLMYDAVNDRRTRPAHRAMDGIIRPVGDAFWASHSPPCGHCCRCKLISLTEDEAGRRGGVTQQIPAGAQADQGWGYKPTQQTEALKRIEAQKVAKAEPVIQAAYNAGMKILPSGLPEQHYLDAFMRSANAPVRIELFGASMIIDERLFHDARGNLKITKRGREQFVLYLANAIYSPDNVYEVVENYRSIPGKTLLKRRFLKVFNAKFYAVVSFTWNEAESAFVGATAFIPFDGKGLPDEAYFEKQKTGIIVYSKK